MAEYLLGRPTDFYNYLPEYPYRPIHDNLGFLNENQDEGIHNNSIDLAFKNVSQTPGNTGLL